MYSSCSSATFSTVSDRVNDFVSSFDGRRDNPAPAPLAPPAPPAPPALELSPASSPFPSEELLSEEEGPEEEEGSEQARFAEGGGVLPPPVSAARFCS